MAKTLNLTLKVWRQENREAKGRIETYAAKDIPVDASFLEMLDIVNEGLVKEGKEAPSRTCPNHSGTAPPSAVHSMRSG